MISSPLRSSVGVLRRHRTQLVEDIERIRTVVAMTDDKIAH